MTGGIEVICQNLVMSNQRVINLSPSLVSTIMQYLASARPNTGAGAAATKRITENENGEGLTNFAPLGTKKIQFYTIAFIVYGYDW